MPLVVFLRGVNVGGHKAFQPSRLAKELAHLGAINVGAAGTFVIPGAIGQGALRAEILERLPFAAEVMICPAREVIELAGSEPFPKGRANEDLRRFVSVMGKRPGRLPELPIHQPPGDAWEVKVVGVSGRFALSLWRPTGRPFRDPNAIVEKRIGVSATTRNWNTIVKIGELLKQGRQR
jgi:uncharacterized protein (DUF1697 family)